MLRVVAPLVPACPISWLGWPTAESGNVRIRRCQPDVFNIRIVAKAQLDLTCAVIPLAENVIPAGALAWRHSEQPRLLDCQPRQAAREQTFQTSAMGRLC